MKMLILNKKNAFKSGGITELLGHCKRNFNIHNWACLSYFICSRRKIRLYLFELISCLSRANVRAFHINPDGTYTELKFVKP